MSGNRPTPKDGSERSPKSPEMDRPPSPVWWMKIPELAEPYDANDLRNLERNRERENRRAQILDKEDSNGYNTQHLFREPITEKKDSDHFHQWCTKAMGSWCNTVGMIHSNPKNLIGVQPIPTTPVKPQKQYGPQPLGTSSPSKNKPAYHNGQHGRPSGPEPKRDRQPLPAAPHGPPPGVSSAPNNIPEVRPRSESAASQKPPQPQRPMAPQLPVAPHKPSGEAPFRLQQVSPVPSHTRHPEPAAHPQAVRTKYPPPGAASGSSTKQRVANGNLRNPSQSRAPVAPKPSPVQNVQQQQHVKVLKEVKGILEEMIVVVPTPVSTIPNPRIASAGNNQLEGNASQSSAKPAHVRQLDFIPARPPPPAIEKPEPMVTEPSLKEPITKKGDVLTDDLEISEDSDDEPTVAAVQKSPQASADIGAPEHPATPLTAMSQRCESSSSGSSESSSESESEDDASTKSHSHSAASDSDSRPESPINDESWNLDRFIQVPPPMPLGLPDSISIPDQDSRSVDISYFTSDKDLSRQPNAKLMDEDDFCSVPDLIKDFSKEDVKNLMPSPTPCPLRTIDDLPQEDVFSTAIEDARPLSPIPSTPISKKKSLANSPRAPIPSMPSIPSALQSSTKVNSDTKSTPNEMNKVLGKNSFQKAGHDNAFPSTKAKVLVPEKSRDSGHKGDIRSQKERQVIPTPLKSKQSELSSAPKKPNGENKPVSDKNPLKKTDKASKKLVASKLRPEGMSKRAVSPEAPIKAVPQAQAKVAPTPPLRQNSSGSSSGKKEHGPAKPLTTLSQPSLPSTPPLLPSSSASKTSGKVIGKKTSSKKDVSSNRKNSKKPRSEFKSKEILESDDSDSENEIDVVNSSPLKMLKGTNASSKGPSRPLPSSVKAEKITETINAVSAGAGTVKKQCLSPTHRPRTPKSRPSKVREVAERLGGSVCSSTEELSAKTILLSPIGNAECEAPRIPVLEFNDGIPSLMVKLDLSMLSRVPQNPANKECGKKEKVGKKTLDPSITSEPKDTGKSKNKGPVLPCVKEAEPKKDDSKKVFSKKPKKEAKMEVERSATPEAKAVKRPLDESDSNPSQKKKMKLSKELGASSLSLSSSSSSLHKKESSQHKLIEEKVKKKQKNRDKSADSSSSVVKVPKSKPNTDSSATTKNLKSKEKPTLPIKQKSISSSSVKEEKKPKMPKESSDKKEKLKSQKEKDAQLPSKPQIKSEVEAERCRPVEKESSVPKSPVCSRSNSPGKARGVKRSLEAVAGPSQNSGNSMQKPKDLKKPSKERGSTPEEEKKRRKYDSMQPSQTSSTEAPKTSNNTIQGNTNHDRVPPNGDVVEEPKILGLHSINWEAVFAKINREFELRPDHNQQYYLEIGREFKRHADTLPDKATQVLCYLKAIALFFVAGSIMEQDNCPENLILSVYNQSYQFISCILNICATNNGNAIRKMEVLIYFCQSILNLKMFKLRKTDIFNNSRVLNEYQKTVHLSTQQIASPHQPSPSNARVQQAMLWNNNKTTGAPSPISPLPSPAGSVGSVESMSSGYSSSEIGAQNKVSNSSFNLAAPHANPVAAISSHPPHQSMHATPLLVYTTLNKQIEYLTFAANSHDFYDQAALLITRGNMQEYFSALDAACGKLTLHSSSMEVAKYVMAGLECLGVRVPTVSELKELYKNAAPCLNNKLAA